MNNLPDTESGTSSTPAAEVDVSDDLVRALLTSQVPDLAGLPLRLVETGWDNFTYRLGPAFVVRLPRRAVGAILIEREQTWLPRLAPQLPLPTPVPIHVGEPGEGYPWRWSVLPWLEGDAADCFEPDSNQAEPIAAFMRALHTPASEDAPPNPVRGVPLATRAAGVEERLRRLEVKTDSITPGIWHIWREALDAPVADEHVWLHGDLHARNVLVQDGAISGIIDWGDLTAGDPATDLAAIWMLLKDAGARACARTAYGADEATWVRAKGWAVLFGAVLLDTGLTDSPRHAVMGKRTFQNLQPIR